MPSINLPPKSFINWQEEWLDHSKYSNTSFADMSSVLVSIQDGKSISKEFDEFVIIGSFEE